MTAIVDLTYLFYRTLFIFTGFEGNGKPNPFETPEDCGMFARKIATDLAFELRQLKSVDRLVACLDSSSWRKEVESVYKSGRGDRSESPVNWDEFFAIMEEFQTFLKEKGAIVSKVKRAEADDLIYLWTKHFSDAGESCAILTGDRDLYQCVRAEAGKGAVVVINNNSKTRKIVVHPRIHQWLKETDTPDVFNLSSMTSDADVISDLYQKHPKLEVNPDLHVFEKILMGDGGDDVPNLYYWKDGFNKDGTEKIKRVTPALVVKVWDKVSKGGTYDSSQPLINPQAMEALHVNLEIYTKQRIPRQDMEKRYELNRTLMFLDESTIPVDIQEAVSKSYKEDLTVLEKFTMQTLLANTRYVKNIEVKLDIFKELILPPEMLGNDPTIDPNASSVRLAEKEFTRLTGIQKPLNNNKSSELF